MTATQVDTGLTRTVVTDEGGAYALTNLPTGPYRLEVSLTGFRTYQQTGIVLQVGASPVINATLAVGSLEETVSVEGAAPLVDVKSAGISSVVDNQRILELPLQGRQVTDLLVLAGAAVQTGVPARGVPGGVNIAVAGGLPFGVAYTLDGSTHNNPQSNTNICDGLIQAIKEFQAIDNIEQAAQTRTRKFTVLFTDGAPNAFRGEFLARFSTLSPAPLEQFEALEQLRALWHGYPIVVAVRPDAPHAGVDTEEDLRRVRDWFAKPS